MGGSHGRAFFDAQSNEVLVTTDTRAYVVTFSELITVASQGDPIRASQIGADLNAIFKSGAVVMGNLSSDAENIGLNGPRNYCNYVGCEPAANDWDVGSSSLWDFQKMRPPSLPPPPPAPSPCMEAMELMVETKFAFEGTQASCKVIASKGKAVWCAAAYAYTQWQAAKAAERASQYVAPPPPPPAPTPRDLWGLGL